MAKNYKVRKNCMICKEVFFPAYSGALYCHQCKGTKQINEGIQHSFA